MFKLIGGAVVCGFALYGLAKYLSRVKMNPTLGDVEKVAKSKGSTSEVDEVHTGVPKLEGGAASASLPPSASQRRESGR